MSTQSNQKFMTLFNDLLEQSHGSTELKKLLLLNEKGDEVDTVNLQREQSLNFRLDERNILFLKKVEMAKQKILDGTYGLCEDCGSDISQGRLIARPTACLCIDCQEEKERNEFNSFKKRRDLSPLKLTEENDSEYISNQSTFNTVSEIVFESVIDM